MIRLEFTFNKLMAVFAISALSVALIGCGKKESNASAKPTQVVARVNDYDITVSQLNAELQRTNVKPEQQTQAAQQILNAMIDRQVLVQEAVKQKLDRNAGVLNAIDIMKMQTLAQSVVQSNVTKVAKPTNSEVMQYIAEHKQSYDNRKIYVVEQLILGSGQGSKELEQFVDKTKSLDDVKSWLKTNNKLYAQISNVLVSDSLPVDFSNQLEKMKEGDLFYLILPQGNMVEQIKEIKNAPTPIELAKITATNALMQEKSNVAYNSFLSTLRKSAKIEYFDKKLEPNAAAEVSKSVSEAKVSASEEKAADDGKNQGNKDYIKKGLSGL